MASAVWVWSISSHHIGIVLSYALAMRKAVGLNFCTSGWLRKVSEAITRFKAESRRVPIGLPVTGKNSTHALREIQEAIGNVELSREDEELRNKNSKICASSFLTFSLKKMRSEIF